MVTRVDMIPCPSCHAHLRAAEASCPFCGALLAVPASRRGGASAGVRRAVAAATFFGVTAIAACAYGEPPDFDDVSPDVVEDAAGEVTPDAEADVTGDLEAGDGADAAEADAAGDEGR